MWVIAEQRSRVRINQTRRVSDSSDSAAVAVIDGAGTRTAGQRRLVGLFT